MSFLFPAMLLGFLGLAAPLALHLIARHKFPVRDFPSIRLLKYERRYNVFAPRLVDPLQLALRLIVLALLTLAMARLFTSCSAGRAAPRNLVVVLDSSASMRMSASASAGGNVSVLDAAKAQAGEIFSKIRSPSRCALVEAGATTRVLAPLLPDPSSVLAALATVVPGDASGPGLVSAVAVACDLVRGRREARSQIVVFTDLRASSLETRRQEDLRRIRAAAAELGRALDIIFVNLAPERIENAAVIDARIRGREVRLGDDAQVAARIVHSGESPRHVSAALAIAGRNIARSRPVPVPPGGEAVVQLSAPVNRAMRGFAEVSLGDTDAFAFDDSRLVPLNVSDACRILIVKSDEKPVARSGLDRFDGGTGPGGEETAAGPDGAAILRYVFNPARELGLAYGTGYETSLTTVDALAFQPLSKYDVIILYDLSRLPEKALADIESFVRLGKGVLIFGSGGVNPLLFNRAMASGTQERPALSPATLGNEREPAEPVGFDQTALAHPVMAPFRDRLHGDLSAARFGRIRELPSLADGAEVMFRADDGSPLAVEKKLEEGRVILAAFGVELSRSNLARTRAFPVLMWRIADYLAGRMVERRPDIFVAGSTPVLDVSEAPFAFQTELELVAAQPAGTGATASASAAAARTQRLAVSADRTVVLGPLQSGGYYLQKARTDAGTVGGYARPVAVNSDPSESRMEKATADELAVVFGACARTVSPDSLEGLAIPGFEFWTIFLVLMVLAYAAEALVGFMTNAARERGRAGGGAS